MPVNYNAALIAAEQENNALRAKLKAIRQTGDVSLMNAIELATSAGTSFGMSYVEGRYPDRATIVGVPSTLVLAAGAMTASVMGWGGRTSAPYLNAIATGSLCAYTASQGRDQGLKAHSK